MMEWNIKTLKENVTNLELYVLQSYLSKVKKKKRKDIAKKSDKVRKIIYQNTYLQMDLHLKYANNSVPQQ